MSPRVFVVQESPQINITPAMDFGELIFLLGPGVHSFNPARMLDSMRVIFEDRNFQPEDYLLLIGDPVAIGAACATADQWLQVVSKHSKLRVLKWDNQHKRYLALELPLSI